MTETSDAQKRSEEEVRKIMEERGYNTKAYHKEQRKGSRDFSSLPKIIIAVIVVVAGIIGGKQLVKNLSQQQSKTTNVNSYSYEELAQKFKDCLNSISANELTPEDENYSESMSTSLKERINCYEIYPEVSDYTEKATLQLQLSELESISQDNLTEEERKKRYAEIDAEYQQTISQANKKYSDAMARLDAEKAANDTKTKEWLANYDKEQAARDAEYAKQQAEKESATKARQEEEARKTAAKKAACEEYKKQYGDKTAAELAEADAEVVSAKYMMSRALKKVRSCTGGNRVLTQSQRDACNSYRAQEQQTADSYESTYRSLLSQKTNYYRNLKIEACGY